MYCSIKYSEYNLDKTLPVKKKTAKGKVMKKPSTTKKNMKATKKKPLKGSKKDKNIEESGSKITEKIDPNAPKIMKDDEYEEYLDDKISAFEK